MTATAPAQASPDEDDVPSSVPAPIFWIRVPRDLISSFCGVYMLFLSLTCLHRPGRLATSVQVLEVSLIYLFDFCARDFSRFRVDFVTLHILALR